MNKTEYLLLALIILGTALLVYSPHFTYHYPLHIDEWHHITEAMKLQSGEYTGGSIGYRFGFHVFLLSIAQVTDIITFYQFLPAIWAVLTALALYWTTYKTTTNHITALLAVIFFASLKSNVNLLGTWFFTPLAFSLPFIFLYLFFFNQGLVEQNKKYLLVSLGIMLLLLPIHAVAVLFALPLLALTALIHLRYLKQEKRFFSLFLLIPLIGLLFYAWANSFSLVQSFASIWHALQFAKGWGILELNNSFLETYSLIGYLLAILGIYAIFKNPERKRFLIYVFWPITLLIMILIFRFTEVSYLSPYQRNFFYFALSMPFLSAVGVHFLLMRLKENIGRYAQEHEQKEKLYKIAALIILAGIAFFTFHNYYETPPALELYHIIEPDDLPVFEALKKYPPTIIMIPPQLGTALYPFTRHEPVATLSFYGIRDDVELFYRTEDCVIKNALLKKYKAMYVVTPAQTACLGWQTEYAGTYTIFKVA
ncbi:hypothetical protein HYZ97_03065 [Candidatus Pacearchaeota archaeon]|nr:hypothetical protein [Candidatus Pacearchaeota archaeon]